MANNIRLSGSQTVFRSESDIRFNYGNPKQIVGACNDLQNSTLEIFSSTDGGSTWSNSQLPTVTGDSFQSDPAVDWTSDGTAWALCIGVISNPPLVANVRSFKSTDQGSTWTFDSNLSLTNTSTDKASLWVDHSPTSPYQDHLYAIWHDGNPTYIAMRNGPGGTWNTPILLTGSESSGTTDGGDVKTNAFGDVFAFWPSSGNQKLFVAKSTNGGTSFGSPIQIATTNGSFWYPIPAQASRNVLIYITGGAYRTASEDVVYACWHDLAGGSGCNSNSNAPGSNASSTCKNRIWFTRSTDGGTTWETPRKINDQSSLNDQFFPRMVCDQTDGVFTVVYYDTVGNSDRVHTDIWMQTSRDNGVTWSAAIKVTSSESDEATSTANANQYGDYIGITGNAGKFFACWTDSRNSIEEIWGFGFTITDLVTAIANSGNFGNVCVGSFTDELLTINNTGSGPLSISNIISSSADFLVPSVLSFPMVLASGSALDVVIRFQPTSPGPKPTTLTIISNDPSGPHTISVTGDGQTSRLSLISADAGSFGKVCVGSFVDEPLILSNSSRCALTITAMSSSSAEFLVPEVLFYPLTIGGGDSLSIPLRFEPTSPGSKAATLTVTSSDPASPHTIRVTGVAQTSRLSLMMADTGHFGRVCVGSFADEPLLLNNSSHCALTITGITSSSPEFLVPQVLSYPLVIAGGNFLAAPIRFRPTSFGPKSANITVTSSDPGSPHTITVEGEAPAGRLTITGSTIFGGVKCGHREQRTVSICNTGECNLHVSHVGFKRKRRHFRLINNPFPATLRPGTCLNVVIQYWAAEKVSRSCELVIHSDDPHDPVRHLDVIAYTIWDCCNECGKVAKKCCCKEPHHDCGDEDDDHDGHERHDEDDEV